MATRSKSRSTLAKSSKSSIIAVDNEFKFHYDTLDKKAAQELKSDTLEIRQRVRQNLENVIEIGKILIKWKQRLDHGEFGEWVRVEFDGVFTHDTAVNMMNTSRLLEKYSIDDLRNMQLSAIYMISRSNVPEIVQAEIIEAANESDQRFTRKDARSIINKYRTLNVQTVNGLTNDAAKIVRRSAIAERPETLQQIARLSQTKQVEVADLLSRYEDLSVRKALALLKGDTGIVSPFIETVTADYEQFETRHGVWEDLISDLENDSLDLVLMEAPLSKTWRENYGVFSELIYPKLADGAIVLSIVGQQNIQFVGPLLEPLNIAWTAAILRRIGYSPRVVGLNFASTILPLSIAYKNVWRKPSILVDDLRIVEPDESDALAPKDDETGENWGGEIEGAVAYYVGNYLGATDRVAHIVCQKGVDGLNSVVQRVCREKNAGSLITLIGS